MPTGQGTILANALCGLIGVQRKGRWQNATGL